MTGKTNSDHNLEWPSPGKYGSSVVRQFSILVSLAIIVLMGMTGYVITDQFVKTVTDQVVHRLVVQARSYSGPAGKLLLSSERPDALLLNNICRKLSQDSKVVYWSGITDAQEEFIAHTDIKQVISKTRWQISGTEEHHATLREDERFSRLGDTLLISVPIVENGLVLGHLCIASSSEEITSARTSSMLTVASITAIMILLGIPVTMIIVRRRLSPIGVITKGLKEMDVNDPTLVIPVADRNEFGYLAETLHVMGMRLSQAQQERVEQERLDRELEIAREIQARILPTVFPKNDLLEFSGLYQSAKEVGGDYYDFIEIDEHRIAFLVADVSGKSLPGMLVMLMTRDIVRNLVRTVWQPSDLLSQVNRELQPNIKKGMFVTMFYGVLDKRTGRFSFASAGHNPVLRISGDSSEVTEHNPKGYPLGMMPPDHFDKRIEESEFTLSPGDWIVQYTDGINEAQNPDKEEFGMDRFMRSLSSLRSLEPSSLVAEFLTQHQKFVNGADQYDDITMVVLKWIASPQNPSPVPLSETIHAN